MNETKQNILLEAQGINRIYYQGKEELRVLKDINLKIEKSQITSIVGPSGAGKSTLMHILGGLDRPDKGRVFFNGRDIYELSDNKLSRLRNQKIGFVFQFYHLLPEFSALENVILPGLIARKKKQELEKKGLGLLRDVGLEERVSHRPSELSGGEQQRVAIARAMINEPEIILCDEPTGNLDSDNSQRMMDLIKDLNKKNEQTFVLVTHEEQTAACANRTVKIVDGEIN